MSFPAHIPKFGDLVRIGVLSDDLEHYSMVFGVVIRVDQLMWREEEGGYCYGYEIETQNGHNAFIKPTMEGLCGSSILDVSPTDNAVWTNLNAQCECSDCVGSQRSRAAAVDDVAGFVPTGIKPKELRQLLRKLSKAGVEISLTSKNHVRVKCPDGYVVCGGTSSDHRVVRNLKADCRRYGLDVDALLRDSK